MAYSDNHARPGWLVTACRRRLGHLIAHENAHRLPSAIRIRRPSSSCEGNRDNPSLPGIEPPTHRPWSPPTNAPPAMQQSQATSSHAPPADLRRLISSLSIPSRVTQLAMFGGDGVQARDLNLPDGACLACGDASVRPWVGSSLQASARRGSLLRCSTSTASGLLALVAFHARTLVCT